MINAKAIFDKNGDVKFEKMKWKVPIQALVKVTIQELNEKFNVLLISDRDKQNAVLVEH
jgi:hypothetical protein